MKKTIIAAILLAASSAASAAGIGAGIVVGGGATGFAGSASGNAFSNSEGMAVAASQVAGSGTSYQSTHAYGGGSATVGGSVNSVGAQVVTNHTQYAVVDSFGAVSGNAPIQAGNAIANGTSGFSQTKVGAYGTSNFQTGAIGGLVGFGAAVGFGGF